MTIENVLQNAKKELIKNNIDDPGLNAKMLLAHILMCKKEDLIIKMNENLEKDQENQYFQNIEKLKKGYPIQYITKHKEFMKMKFYVDKNVLIPRSDTEILVEEAIKKAQNGQKSILELCTGSGAIAISLSKYVKNIAITATDISEKALEIAKKNAQNLLENENIKFIQSDMFQNIKEKYDIIISNPPYIKTETIKEYSLEYEPKLALDGGKDGLKFYKIIIDQAHKYLKENGIILLEIGYDQKEEIIKLVQNSKKYKEAKCIKDLFGNDRVIIINL